MNMNIDLNNPNTAIAGKKSVTVAYHTNRIDTYNEVDKVTTESYQWRLDINGEILLVPMVSVRAVHIKAQS